MKVIPHWKAAFCSCTVFLVANAAEQNMSNDNECLDCTAFLALPSSKLQSPPVQSQTLDDDEVPVATGTLSTVTAKLLEDGDPLGMITGGTDILNNMAGQLAKGKLPTEQDAIGYAVDFGVSVIGQLVSVDFPNPITSFMTSLFSGLLKGLFAPEEDKSAELAKKILAQVKVMIIQAIIKQRLTDCCSIGSRVYQNAMLLAKGPLDTSTTDDKVLFYVRREEEFFLDVGKVFGEECMTDLSSADCVKWQQQGGAAMLLYGITMAMDDIQALHKILWLNPTLWQTVIPRLQDRSSQFAGLLSPAYSVFVKYRKSLIIAPKVVSVPGGGSGSTCMMINFDTGSDSYTDQAVCIPSWGTDFSLCTDGDSDSLRSEKQAEVDTCTQKYIQGVLQGLQTTLGDPISKIKSYSASIATAPAVRPSTI